MFHFIHQNLIHKNLTNKNFIHKPQKIKPLLFLIVSIGLLAGISGCGAAQNGTMDTETFDAKTPDAEIAEDAEATSAMRENTEVSSETIQDTAINFEALKAKNPDIFAWIHIPGTKIDYPILQSELEDDYYETHNADGEEDAGGAIYIELANLTSMCDFNTVLHGKTGAEEDGLFADLYRFADPDFFEEHENVYLYLDGNVLTYKVFAAYERENTSLIRSYDFTYLAGCQQFLDDLYGTRSMSMNLREGWDSGSVTPYHFLITLTTQKEDAPDRQFVVIALLVQDAAGTIDRVVWE